MTDSTSRCTDPDHHVMHICQLSKKGLKDEIAERNSDPGFICHNCAATANQAKDLCNPSPLVSR